jgi:hypothetical protein
MSGGFGSWKSCWLVEVDPSGETMMRDLSIPRVRWMRTRDPLRREFLERQAEGTKSLLIATNFFINGAPDLARPVPPPGTLLPLLDEHEWSPLNPVREHPSRAPEPRRRLRSPVIANANRIFLWAPQTRHNHRLNLICELRD